MTEPEDYTVQNPDSYYATDHFEEFAEHFKDIRNCRVLNIGCGKGQSLESRPRWSGVDFNPDVQSERVSKADARKLIGFWQYEFEYTVSVDFLEHVKPEDVPTVSEELHRVAEHGIHVIHLTAESYFRGVDGKNLHPSGNKPIEWWAEQLGAETTLIGHHLLAQW